ncbi:uncharacterized protein EV422DRAFT_525509 [Fimicolochytrium jonesii]|uniref:uncharacterized protein n=1 Tax=Fimicolochytrium jonesii TaxID=1396493 RepID=UPI0022FE9D00|nr:uncharacterized protein EV422DRAFT_525509 [Fimicolochytrium jonesii]KAI8822060.1 hypothetical protein EV422DRAFT_525509 [Fimicolochytrium jonesii]
MSESLDEQAVPAKPVITAPPRTTSKAISKPAKPTTIAKPLAHTSSKPTRGSIDFSQLLTDLDKEIKHTKTQSLLIPPSHFSHRRQRSDSSAVEFGPPAVAANVASLDRVVSLRSRSIAAASPPSTTSGKSFRGQSSQGGSEQPKKVRWSDDLTLPSPPPPKRADSLPAPARAAPHTILKAPTTAFRSAPSHQSSTAIVPASVSTRLTSSWSHPPRAFLHQLASHRRQKSDPETAEKPDRNVYMSYWLSMLDDAARGVARRTDVMGDGAENGHGAVHMGMGTERGKSLHVQAQG